jgi:hypothetical protein
MIRSKSSGVLVLAVLLGLPTGRVRSADGPGIKPANWKAGRILFLGNSITLHGPLPAIGWTGNWGMAASAEEKDYVHVLAASIARLTGSKPELRVANIADFERQFDRFDLDSFKEHLAFRPDIIVVAIGENVSALTTEQARATYKDRFGKLLARLKENGQPAIYVRSCFWPDKTKDDIMQQCCKAAGSVFVDIGHLGRDASNQARSERSIAHGGVAGHPGDKGMKAIADALLKAMTTGSNRLVPKPPATTPARDES